jgi:EF-P beta-lysylation protein EpmB
VSNRVLSGEGLLARLPGSSGSAAASAAFPARATRAFVEAIDTRDARDPLLLQVLPRAAELESTAGFQSDPVADAEHEAAPGLIHKYENRVLLLSSAHCPIHCRYCFRKNFAYPEQALSPELVSGWQAYVAARPEIDELIFSGGDPLFADLGRLAQAIAQLAALPHVRAVRFHTRVPLVYPELVSADFRAELRGLGKRVCFVLHVNHPRELNPAALELLERLRADRFLLLSQSVLLAGVNDSPRVLRELFTSLADAGVLPYYLNLLDRVSGSGHFEVEEGRAREIYRALLASSSGYTVPKLVRDDGGAHKSLVC